MDDEHQNLVDSMLHFLSPEDDARVWVVAGFHTGRRKVADFFETARRSGLEIERVWERDCEGREREWELGREGKDDDVDER